MYTLRSDDGLMIAKIGNVCAHQLISEFSGHWAEKNFKSGKKLVFVFDDDYSLGVGVTDTTLFVWKGYYIVPSK